MEKEEIKSRMEKCEMCKEKEATAYYYGKEVCTSCFSFIKKEKKKRKYGKQ